VIEFREKIKSIEDWTPNCSYCQYTESISPISLRLFSDRFIKSDDDLTLELQLDITCNGGCVICGPHLSTFWQSQFKKFNIQDVVPIKLKAEPNIVKDILSVVDIQKCKRILFSGGEALLSSHDLEIITAIKDKSVVTLQYITNGSVKPSAERAALWAQFKEVKLICSIDAIEKQFEYIRYPLQWDEVEHNLLTMRDTMPESVTFGINHTATAMSLYYTDRFIEWHSEKFNSNRFGKQHFYTIHPAHGTWNTSCIPDDLRNIIIEKYGSDSIVGKLAHGITYSRIDHEHLIGFTDEWDNNRNLHWEDVFPEMVQYMKLN
jgi:organic radical activating enzyme